MVKDKTISRDMALFELYSLCANPILSESLKEILEDIALCIEMEDIGFCVWDIPMDDLNKLEKITDDLSLKSSPEYGNVAKKYAFTSNYEVEKKK